MHILRAKNCLSDDDELGFAQAQSEKRDEQGGNEEERKKTIDSLKV